MKKILLIFVILSLVVLFGCEKGTASNNKNNGEQYSLVNGKPKYKSIDIDLSTMKGSIAYSQVYDMVYYPKKYENKVVKMSGQFSVFYSDNTKLYYPAVIIKDATQCCSQGLEFVLYGNPSYPNNYPEKNTEITVIGIFKTYYEDGNPFYHLVDSVII